MKAFLFVTVLAILLSTTAFAQEETETDNRDMLEFPHPYFFGYPRFIFPHPKITVPKKGAMPPMPPFVGDRVKCYEAMHDPDMHACSHDLISFFRTHKISVSSDCCSALEKIEGACKSVAKYENPFLKNLVSQHCH